MAKKTVEVFHPLIAGVSYEVDTDKASDWTDQGWTKKEAPASAATPKEKN